MEKRGDGDFEPQEKLDYLIEMVKSTHNQVTDMQKGLSELSTDMQKELSDLSEKQTRASVGAVNPEKIIMPRTFILLPYKTEEVPVPSNATTQVGGDVDVVQLALASSSAMGWFESKAGKAMQGVKQKLKEGYESAKDTANSIASRAMRVCWKTLRVQFICPVTMQPAPMVEGGPCIITLPTDTLIYSAKALKYGTILLKIVLATQGLGGVVPDISSLIPAEIMDPKELIKQMEDMGNFAEEQYNSVKGKVAGSLGSVGEDISGVVQAGADKELAQLRDKFQNVFDGAAESDGTSNMLAIYKLIAKARGQKSLEIALQNTWQPQDKDHRKWGMVLVQPKGSDTWIWASEEGAKRLKEVGMAALDPKADVNRETVKTGSTMTEFAASTAGAAAEAMAKKAGIDVVGIKTKCISYGIAPEAIVCIVANPSFLQILLAVSSSKKDDGKKEKAEALAKGSMMAEIMKATPLSEAQVDALMQLFLSGGTDWSGLEALEQAALQSSGVLAGMALWEAAKRVEKLKFVAIQRRAEKEGGLRSGEVEKVFVAAVKSPLFKSAIEALISGNSDSAAFRQFESNVFAALMDKGNMFAALVDGIAEKTGISLPEIDMVLSALITGDLTKLQPLATGTQAPVLVEERGLKVLWALVKKIKVVHVDKVEKCAKTCGLRPVDVEAVFVVAVSDPAFKDAVRKLMSDDRSDVTQGVVQGLSGNLLQLVATKTGVPPDTINAVIDAILTGNLAKLEEVAKNAGKVVVADQGPKALWALAKQAKSLKIAAIERRAERICGLRPGDLEAIFEAAADSPVFKSVIEAVISGKPYDAGVLASLYQEDVLADLVLGVETITGLSPALVETVLSTLVSGDLDRLQAVNVDAVSGPAGLKLLWAFAKRLGVALLPVGAIEKTAQKCGFRMSVVESIFVVAASDPVFKAASWKLMGGDKDAAAAVMTVDVVDKVTGTVADRTGLPPALINAMIDAILTGNLAKLEEVAKNAGKVVVADQGPKALWALAKQAKSLKIAAIERRAEEHGIKAGEVKMLFLAAASDPVFVAATQALTNNQPGAAKDLVQGSTLDALVALVSEKTGLLPIKVQAVIIALLTTKLTALDALVSVPMKPLVSPRVAGFRDEVTSGGASVLHEVLKGKELLLQQKEEAMKEKERSSQAALQHKDEVLKQKDETLQLLRSQLEEAKKREADLLRSNSANAIGSSGSTAGTGSNFFGFRR